MALTRGLGFRFEMKPSHILAGKDRKPLTFEQMASVLYRSGDQASFLFRYHAVPVQESEMLMVREKPIYSDDPKDHFWYSFGTDYRRKLVVRQSLEAFKRDLQTLFKRHRVKDPVSVDRVPYPDRRLF
jgi:hypothetical protein